MSEPTLSEKVYTVPWNRLLSTLGRREAWLEYRRQIGILVALLVLCAILAIANPSFISHKNVINLMRQSSLLVLIGLGQMLVLLTAGIDLSVGSIAGLAGIVSGHVMAEMGYPTGVGILAGLAIGLACGLVNGFFVAKVQLNPFVVTLGTSTAFRGLIVVATRGYPTVGLPDAFTYIGTGDILGIPITFVVSLMAIALIHLVLAGTPLGRKVHGIGSDERAMAWWGVKTGRVRLTVFVLSGLLAAMAGVLLVARLNWAKPEAGAAWLLPSIAAAVLGGTSMTGGEGKAVGVLIGAIFLAVIDNGLVLLGASQFLRDIMIGIVIIVAVSFDLLYRRLQRS